MVTAHDVCFVNCTRPTTSRSSCLSLIHAGLSASTVEVDVCLVIAGWLHLVTDVRVAVISSLRQIRDSTARTLDDGLHALTTERGTPDWGWDTTLHIMTGKTAFSWHTRRLVSTVVVMASDAVRWPTAVDRYNVTHRASCSHNSNRSDLRVGKVTGKLHGGTVNLQLCGMTVQEDHCKHWPERMTQGLRGLVVGCWTHGHGFDSRPWHCQVISKIGDRSLVGKLSSGCDPGQLSFASFRGR